MVKCLDTVGDCSLCRRFTKLKYIKYCMEEEKFIVTEQWTFLMDKVSKE